MLSPTDKKIAKALAVTTAEAAALATGVSAAYVSQLQASVEFQELVASYKAIEADNCVAREAHNARLDRIEHRVAEQLEETISIGLVHDPLKLLGILTKLNQLQRRAKSTDPQAQVTMPQVVTLEISNYTAQKLQLDSANRAVSIGDRVLATMDTEVLAEEVYNGQSVASLSRGEGKSKPYKVTGTGKDLDL